MAVPSQSPEGGRPGIRPCCGTCNCPGNCSNCPSNRLLRLLRLLRALIGETTSSESDEVFDVDRKELTFTTPDSFDAVLFSDCVLPNAISAEPVDAVLLSDCVLPTIISPEPFEAVLLNDCVLPTIDPEPCDKELFDDGLCDTIGWLSPPTACDLTASRYPVAKAPIL